MRAGILCACVKKLSFWTKTGETLHTFWRVDIEMIKVCLMFDLVTVVISKQDFYSIVRKVNHTNME